MTLLDWFNLLGGIGMFLFGMNLLGTSLEKAAGPKLEKTLEKLAGGMLRGVLLGAGVTAVIQSSSATSIMVIGFVNSGIMKLAQGVTVMMGANIGTTVTGQILRLGDISSSSWVAFLKPASFAPLCIAAGAAIRLLSKKPRLHNIASMILGFGILFVGMSTIESAFAPFQNGEMPAGLFDFFQNPLLGFFTGVLATSVLQSSSASVGVLQAISTTGQLNFHMAAPIVLGMNVGKFVPVLMASAGTNARAKRAVVVNIMICTAGSVLFLVCMYLWQAFVGFSFWERVVGRGNIADFNTIFNVATTVVMLPFCQLLVKLSGKLIPGEEVSKADRELALLDPNFLKTPALALAQCHKVVCAMGESARENFDIATAVLRAPSPALFAKLNENEDFLDKAESRLGEYLVQITATGLDHDATRFATQIMYAVGDFERVGDYAVNVSDVAAYNRDNHISFSDIGWNELSRLFKAAGEIQDITLRAFVETDPVSAGCVEPLEETIDSMVEALKQRHIDRLQRGECDIRRDISYTELLTNVERISDHCSNIAVNLFRRVNDDRNFDAHEELNRLHRTGSAEYDRLYQHYMSEYREKL